MFMREVSVILEIELKPILDPMDHIFLDPIVMKVYHQLQCLLASLHIWMDTEVH